MLRTKRAEKARSNRKNILQQKKAKILKAMLEENITPSNIYLFKGVSSFRSPLADISPNILTHVNLNNHASFHNHVSESSVQHTHLNASSNTQPNTFANVRLKNKYFIQINKLGVNLDKQFDSRLSNKTPAPSNTIPLTILEPNSIFANDNEDTMEGDTQGIPEILR